MNYYDLKHAHMGFAALSAVFFVVRGLWMLSGSRLLHARWVSVAPHLVDTLLLASAIGLVVWSGQYPFQAPWLGAKVLALLAYICLGTVALRRGRTPRIRAIAFGAALACLAYIVAVALAKRPFIVA